MPIIDSQKLEVVLKKSWIDRVGGFFSGTLRVLLIVLFFGIVFGVFHLDESVSNTSEDTAYQQIAIDPFYREVDIDPNAKKIAMINISGVITSSSVNMSLPEEFVSRDETISLLMDLVNDEDISGILLVINSPGGEVIATEQITGMIDVVNAQKPVYVLIENMAASGGYYIATSAQKVYAYPGSIVGNIGVRIDIPNLSGMLDKVGVEMQTVDSGEFKTMGSPFRAMSEAEKGIFQSMIDESYETFVDRVASGRKMDREKVLLLADGRVYSGLQAMENGLIDKTVGSLLDLSGEISGEIGGSVQFIRFVPMLSAWEQVLMHVHTSLSPMSTYFSKTQTSGLLVQ